MSYYVCLGKTNYYSTTSKPTYKFGGEKYFDYFEYFQGYAKTPKELNVSYPYPEKYTDGNGKVWALKKGNIPDNHQFKSLQKNSLQGIVFKNQTAYNPRNREKSQPEPAVWNSIDSNTPGLWKNLKRNGMLGE